MRTLLTVLYLTLYFTSNAQVEKVDIKFTDIGTAKSGMAFIAKLSYHDSTVFLSYSDLTYKTIDEIKTISFNGGMGAIDELYKQMNDALQNKTENTLKIGKQLATFAGIKTMGVKSLRITVVNEYGISSWFQLSEKQFNKLFGK